MPNTVFPQLPDTAMVLAAGHGKRLLPLTKTRPKPMVPIAGKPLIDHALDRLQDAGIQRTVVNTFYLGEQIEQHLLDRTTPEIIIAREPELLDTGGGVLNALDHFGGDPVLITNSDMILTDAFSNVLQRMGAAYDASCMDILLLLQSVIHAQGYRGMGDFTMSAGGRLKRRLQGRIAPFVYTGVQILHPRIFEGMAVEPFSLNRVYDAAIATGRLFGIRHDGGWADAGHAAGLVAAATLLQGKE